MNPQPWGPDWMQMIPKAGSLFHATSHWLGSLGVNLERIGLEAGPLSQWLYAALQEAGLVVELQAGRRATLAKRRSRSRRLINQHSVRHQDKLAEIAESS